MLRKKEMPYSCINIYSWLSIHWHCYVNMTSFKPIHQFHYYNDWTVLSTCLGLETLQHFCIHKARKVKAWIKWRITYSRSFLMSIFLKHISEQMEKKNPNNLAYNTDTSKTTFSHTFIPSVQTKAACIDYNQSLLRTGQKFPVAINRAPMCLSSVRTRRFFFEWRCAKHWLLYHHEKVKKINTYQDLSAHLTDAALWRRRQKGIEMT